MKMSFCPPGLSTKRAEHDTCQFPPPGQTLIRTHGDSVCEVEIFATVCVAFESWDQEPANDRWAGARANR